MTTIIEEVAKFIFRFIVEILFSWTGEMVLFVLSFGKHKPRWDLYATESPTHFVIFSEVSLWIGIAFWILVVVAIYSFISR